MKSLSLDIFALLCLTQALTPLAQSCHAQADVKITFYGWDDNSPPGAANAFDCGRGKGPDGEPIAGGLGSFSDPISFATATGNSNLPRCGIVYVPELQKYFRNEDDCAECSSDWSSGQQYHIDLWTGSNEEKGGSGLLDCEDSLPGGQKSILVNAPSGLPVDTTPLYSGSACNQKTYPVPSDPSSLCSGQGASTPSTNPKGAVEDLALSAPGTPTTLATSIIPTGPAQGTPSGSSSSSCEWAGHCTGATCQSDNDCSGSGTCGTGNTCVAAS